MIQIIGFMGCLYLIVKALEIGSNSAMKDGNGRMKGEAIAAVWIASLGAFVFAFWLYTQGADFDQLRARPEAVEGSTAQTMTPAQVECVSKAKGDKAVLACMQP